MSTHVASLCFDDGFRRTTSGVADFLERRGLHACFAVLAAPQMSSDLFLKGAEFADWGLLRDMRARGHEIAPHGWAHERLSDLSCLEATASIDRTLATFERELPGFNPAGTMFHLPYLAAPACVRDHLRTRTMAIRLARGGGGLNRIRDAQASGLVDCITFGPDAVDERILSAARAFIDGPGGWQVFVLHGLDNEGWGPISAAGFERLLDLLQKAGVTLQTPDRVLYPENHDII
jgi:peptidoglycan/xylan/chitin deacetylase (PgdA/CDA1 family)